MRCQRMDTREGLPDGHESLLCIDATTQYVIIFPPRQGAPKCARRTAEKFLLLLLVGRGASEANDTSAGWSSDSLREGGSLLPLVDQPTSTASGAPWNGVAGSGGSRINAIIMTAKDFLEEELNGDERLHPKAPYLER